MRAAPGIGLVLFLVIVGAACGWSSDDPGAVLVVGDSVTRLSEEEIRDRLDWVRAPARRR